MRKLIRKKWIARKFVTIDWIKFDSKEEAEVYEMLKSWKIDKITGIEELKWTKLIDSRPAPVELYPKFTRGKFNIRARRYTPDFLIKKKDWTEVMLEYKSSFTEKKSDYRLRRVLLLFLHGEKINFAELIKIKKWLYEYREYF